VASVEVHQGELIVALSGLERLVALRRGIRVPLSAVCSVCADPAPWSSVRGIRAVGTGMPGMLAYGVRRMTGRRPDFMALHGRGPALRIECAPDAPYSRIIVSVADVLTAAHELSGLCASARRATR
jgi:hypothetical protein